MFILTLFCQVVFSQNNDIVKSFNLRIDKSVEKAIEHIGAKEYMWENESENNWLNSITNNEIAFFYPNTEILICKNVRLTRLLHGSYMVNLQWYSDCRYSAVTTEDVYVPFGRGLNPPPPDLTLYTIYPNPASSTLYFEIDNNAVQQNEIQDQQSNCRVQLYSVMSGVMALDQQVANFSTNFDLNISNVPNGLYSLILLQGNEIVQQETILVQH